MAGTTLFPAAIDDSTTLPDIGPSDQENASGLEHDVVHSNAHAAIKAIEQFLMGTLLRLNSKDGALLSQLTKLAMDVSALQSAPPPAFDETHLLTRDSRLDVLASAVAILQSAPPAFDETKLLSRDSRMDVMASAITLLQRAPAGADPLQSYLISQSFGS